MGNDKTAELKPGARSLFNMFELLVKNFSNAGPIVKHLEGDKRFDAIIKKIDNNEASIDIDVFYSAYLYLVVKENSVRVGPLCAYLGLAGYYKTEKAATRRIDYYHKIANEKSSYFIRRKNRFLEEMVVNIYERWEPLQTLNLGEKVIDNISRIVSDLQCTLYLEDAVLETLTEQKTLATLMRTSYDYTTLEELSYADGNDEGIHWGDSSNGRCSYTNDEINLGILKNYVVLNSISDSVFGDERNFVSVSLIGDKVNARYGKKIEVEDEKRYEILLYIKNDNPSGLNAIAEGVRVSFSLPTSVSNSHTILGYVDATNANPNRYWDGVTLYSKEKFYIEYVKGSAKYCNVGMGTIPLTDSIISNGAPVGYDRFDGKIPGGHKYSGFVSIDVIVRNSISAGLSMQARTKGTSLWIPTVFANIGDEIEFQIKFVNLTANIVKDVMIRDVLPDNLKYINDSTILFNSSYEDGVLLANNTITTTTGINIGSYCPRGSAYIRFSARVVDSNLTKGNYQLVNWASATTDDGIYKDDVSIIIKKRNF